MRSQSYRVIRAAVLVGFLLLAVRSAFADIHEWDIDAESHCDAQAADRADVSFSNTYCDLFMNPIGSCDGDPGIGSYVCRKVSNASGDITNCGNGSGFGGSDTHAFCDVAPSCPDNGVDYPGGVQYPLNNPGTLCHAGACQVRPRGQAVCVEGSCLGQVEFTGELCEPGDPPTGSGSDSDGDGEDDDAPAGCTLNNGVLTCDCNANPSASFCNFDEEDTPNCTTNPDGSVTCVAGGDPEDPADEGDPNNPQNPGTGDDGGGSDDSGSGSGESDSEGGSATSSGDCTIQPTCTGSADQCATLVQVWRSVCELTDTDGQKAPWEDDPDYGRDLKSEAELVNVEGQLDASGIGGGQCPANPSVSVLGTDIELDISMMCDVAGIIRVFVILMGWLTAAFIVYRAF